jgi:hypothetical protein
VTENNTNQYNLNHFEEYTWGSAESNNHFGEILFLPIYSSIYHQQDRTFELTSTLSIHNTDPNNPITILKVNYYNTNGKLVRKFIDEELILNPLETKQFVIEESDETGGTAAKFIVQWVAENLVIKPVIESIMISTSSQQGISFKSESKIISSIGY